MESKHPWAARLGVCVAMLAFAFLGLVVTNISQSGGYEYWKWIVILFALMALWLSWYLRLKKFSISPVTLGHELLHWIGLIATVFLVSRFVELGVFSRFLAGIVVLTLTAQAVFLAGIYIEKTFLFIGIVLGIFAWIVAFTVEYLYLWIAIPVIAAALVGVSMHIWHAHQKSKRPPL